MKKWLKILTQGKKRPSLGLGPEDRPPFTFCEPVWVSGSGHWCIRKTTEVGLKLGGGVDTPSLCGRVEAGRGWDLAVRMTEHHLNENACPKCLPKYRELVGKS